VLIRLIEKENEDAGIKSGAARKLAAVAAGEGGQGKKRGPQGTPEDGSPPPGSSKRARA
jgi:hypothetical protein